MQYGIYDRYRTFTTASEYKLVQSFFAQYQFSSRQEAEAKAGSLGLDIIDILNLNIGGNSSSTNYSQWVNSLESMTYDQFSSTYTVSQSIDKISSKITDLVGQCINQKGLHAYIVPSSDNLNFVYTLNFNPMSDTHPSTTGRFDVSPSTVAQTCTPAGIVGQPNLSIGPQGVSVSCRRTATETVTIVSNTLDGSPSVKYDAYVVPALQMTFTANPATIDSGSSSTLQWSAQNSSQVSILPGFNNLTATGSIMVSPTTTQQYTLSARGLDGNSQNRFVTVNVNPPPLTLSRAVISFHTNDENRDHDTNESIYVNCTGTNAADMNGTFGDREFEDNHDNGPYDLAVRKGIPIGQISSCQIHVDQSPHGNDTWRFNMHLHLEFSNGQQTVGRDYDWGHQELHNNASVTFSL